MKIPDTDLHQLLACPKCLCSLVRYDTGYLCRPCGIDYYDHNKTSQLTLPVMPTDEDRFHTWRHLQENGISSYTNDPDHNLFVHDRPDGRKFSQFCRLRGLVLDVGCGPQRWPSYFGKQRRGISFVGVDPLADQQNADYTVIRAFAEMLPFHDSLFDHILFVTSLDHLMDPTKALRAALRVCKPNGEIDLFLGEKDPDAPRPSNSPKWYTELSRPDGADDLFHFKRLTLSDIHDLAGEVGAKIIEEEVHIVNTFRRNCFVRLIGS